MATGDNQGAIGRRGLLAGAVRAVCGAGVLAALIAVPARRRAEAVALRPPGAVDEAAFLSACVRCGLCVRDCPYKTLSLADVGQGPPLGTPFYNARTVPCEMCEDIPCVAACPTGALDKGLKDIKDARMGSAVLVGHESCLNFQGLRCDVCYRVCPAIDQAITLEQSHNFRTGKHAIFIPTVHTDKCTGCGKCEKACVLDEAAIKVLPHALAVGMLGKHYRLGWKEKEKAGKALIDDIIDLPDRMPEAPAPQRLPGGGFKEFRP
ncbi:MAG: ferredoxin-type protein NapG [Magnetospirillum sp.]|nr:ferredoxin-type protein NapG [Magnetospirillum sp.]